MPFDVHGTFTAIGALLLPNHGSGILCRPNCDNVTLLGDLDGVQRLIFFRDMKPRRSVTLARQRHIEILLFAYSYLLRLTPVYRTCRPCHAEGSADPGGPSRHDTKYKKDSVSSVETGIGMKGQIMCIEQCTF